MVRRGTRVFVPDLGDRTGTVTQAYPEQVVVRLDGAGYVVVSTDRVRPGATALAPDWRWVIFAAVATFFALLAVVIG